MSDVLQVTVDDRLVKRLFLEFPKIANSEANRQYKAVVSTFMRKFSRERLVKGVFLPSTKRKAKKNPKGQPAIPAKARKAGFKARIGGVGKLEGKYVFARTSNPLLLVREKGDPIKGKPYLFIRGTPGKAFGSSKKGKARRAKWESSLPTRWRRWAKPVVAIVKAPKQVGPFPRLRFQATWEAFKPQARMILQKIVTRTIQRAELFLARKRAA
jgi:hypothetical protein